MTPGPRFSATTSASLIRRRAISLPSSLFRSMTVLRLLLLSIRKKKLSTSGFPLFHSSLARSPPSVQADHLPADRGGRAEQEAVLEQFVEAVVEIIARRHHLVLSPGAVGLVFLFEIGLGAADRLGAARRDEHLAAHRHFPRERPFVFVERALVEVHLPLDRRQGVMPVDVPAIGKPPGPPDPDLGVGADPDRPHPLLLPLHRAL